MSQEQKNPDNLEILLQQFELAKPSGLKKQQILNAAKNLWQETQPKTTVNLMRYIKTIAACIAVIVTIELAGNVALTRWRPSVPYPRPKQIQTTLQEYSDISPYARYYSSINHMPGHTNMIQLRQYRMQLQNLLDEPLKESQHPPIRQIKQQSKHTLNQSISSYS